MEPSWSRCTGLRCCAMSHSPITLQIQRRNRPRLSFRACRPIWDPGMGRAMSRLISFSAGTYPGDTLGPYLSQFHLQPTFMGTQPIDQQMVTFLPDVDYMTDATTYQQVQNGIDTGVSLQFDPQVRYLHDGRGLCSFTHVDVLFQAYFVAYLVLGTMGTPRNPRSEEHTSELQSRRDLVCRL